MTTTTEKEKAGALFLGGLIDALKVPRLSYLALGVWVRIADDDKQCLTARALAEWSPSEEEEEIVAALHELEGVGFVRLEPAQGADGTWTTSARVVSDS